MHGDGAVVMGDAVIRAHVMRTGATGGIHHAVAGGDAFVVVRGNGDLNDRACVVDERDARTALNRHVRRLQLHGKCGASHGDRGCTTSRGCGRAGDNDSKDPCRCQRHHSQRSSPTHEPMVAYAGHPTQCPCVNVTSPTAISAGATAR